MSLLDPEQVLTMHDRVGGDEWFVGLVDRFYAAVVADPLLRPMYPDELTEAKTHLKGFLIQYWGGPSTYSEIGWSVSWRVRQRLRCTGPTAWPVVESRRGRVGIRWKDPGMRQTASGRDDRGDGIHRVVVGGG